MFSAQCWSSRRTVHQTRDWRAALHRSGKKKTKKTAYSTLCNHLCTSSFSSSGTTHLEANRQREKRKTAVGTKRQTSFSKCPTTRNSAPRFSKRARTSATPSHEAKLERQRELQPGRYTTRTPQEGRSWPVARLSQEH